MARAWLPGLLAAGLWLAGLAPTWAQMPAAVPDLGDPAVKLVRDPFAHAAKRVGREAADAQALACRESVKAVTVTGSGIAQVRCRLVAYETCMNKALGIVSQSQDTARQCTIIQALAGPAACGEPCEAASRLPKGGSGVVSVKGAGTFTGLTPFAVDCFQGFADAGAVTEGSCAYNQALQCLMNGSAAPAVNDAIRALRQRSCKQYATDHPDQACSACSQGAPRVDHDPRKPDLSARFCTPMLAAKGLCQPCTPEETAQGLGTCKATPASPAASTP